MNTSRYFGVNLLVVGVWLLALAGCKSGPATGEVHGNVTFKKNPVKSGGKITFYNAKTGDAAEADLDANGAYAVATPLPVGEYIVFVNPGLHLVDTDPGKTPKSLEEKPAPDIPRKYRNQVNSPLRWTVKEGKNQADFDMVP